ncbi:MAG: 7-cyano-7-deazaguanine synthase QueC [Fimbriiglobus sp.]
MNTVILFSGGLDSTTLLYHLLAEGHHVRALSVDYGQRHGARELVCACDIALSLGVEHRILDLRSLVGFLGDNGLTDPSKPIPLGEYAPENMSLTVVPNRNMILISVALAWCASTGGGQVAFAAHGGEYTPYPDCQPAFAEAMHHAARTAHEPPLAVVAPFVNWTKTDIVRHGAGLRVPFEKTWSCYVGQEFHCGACGTCIDRRRAFQSAQVNDPTAYLKDQE